MNLSKISRSIVVALFVVMILFFSFTNFKVMNNNSNMEVTNNVTSNIAKLCYTVILISLVLIYMYIKKKLYRMKVKRKIAFIYRYIYIILVITAASLLVVYKNIRDFSKISLVIYVLTSIITGFLVKRIIFNISKSDMLSVLGMFAYSMILNVITEHSIIFNSIFLEFTVLLTVYIIDKLIDELKQRGIKTKKYLWLSVILGICVAISSILGVDIKVWGIIGILSLFITSNLDKTRIFIPKKVRKNNDKMLKIEKIKINKLIVSVIIVALISTSLYSILSFILYRINDVQVLENLKSIKSSKESFMSFNIFKNYVSSFVSFSKTYYMILFIYILFMEILALILKRRYDTKSTIIKLILMLIFVSIAINNINIYYYQPLFTIMLFIVAIINTTNIYYNREERIKLLVS